MKIAGIFLFSCVFLAGIAYSDSAWFLPPDCAGSDLSISVVFHGDEILQSRGPACVDYSDNRDGRWDKQTLSVSFHPNHAITWAEYREEPFDSPMDAELIVDLWLAGADTEDKTWHIGVSVRDADSIYMNTVHVADLTGKTESCLAEGFCLQTTAR